MAEAAAVATTPKKKSSMRVLIIIIVVLILLAGTALGLYYFGVFGDTKRELTAEEKGIIEAANNTTIVSHPDGSQTRTLPDGTVKTLSAEEVAKDAATATKGRG